MVKKQKAGFTQKDLDRMIGQATRLGVGLAIVSKEALDDMIKKKTKDGKFSEKEAKQVVTNIVNESKRREKQLGEKIRSVIKAAKDNSPASKKDMAKMRAEIEQLKNQLKKKKR